MKLPTEVGLKLIVEEHALPFVAQGLVPVIEAESPGGAVTLNKIESTAVPGKPLLAVAVTVVVLDVARNCGPNLVGDAVTVTEGMVAESEFAKFEVSTLSGRRFTLGGDDTKTQIGPPPAAETLLLPQNWLLVWNPIVVVDTNFEML